MYIVILQQEALVPPSSVLSCNVSPLFCLRHSRIGNTRDGSQNRIQFDSYYSHTVAKIQVIRT